MKPFSLLMVEILCPHCEEEIELDDDASGEFACPYCEGEFEWNLESTTKELGTQAYGPHVGGGAALRWAMGLTITIVGFGIMLVSLLGMFLGSQLAGVESEIDSGTGFGAGVILFSILVGLFGLALAIAGIGAIRRNFAAFVACTVLSVLGALSAIASTIDYFFVMESWEKTSEFNPILSLIFWAAMVTGHMFVMFTPRGRMMWME